MNQPEYIIDESTATLAIRLAEDVARILQRAVAERGKATLVVSGGSTPVPFFKALQNQSLPWNQITVTLADERWVPTDHKDSNEKLVREHLLSGAAVDAHFVSLFDDGVPPDAAQDACDQRVQAMDLPFDVVILGMGDDGHTASLFPDADGLMDAVDLNLARLCRSMQPPAAPHPRMTLTLKALVSTRHLLLHITGAKKREVLEYALIDGSIDKAPVSALFLQDQVPVSVYWAGND